MLNNPLTSAQVLAIRQKLHMTQEEFAHHIGVTVTTVNRWEKGVHNPTKCVVKTLLKLKEEFTL